MARTKDVVLAPEQKELMEKEYLDLNHLRMATKTIQVVVILSMMM